MSDIGQSPEDEISLNPTQTSRSPKKDTSIQGARSQAPERGENDEPVNLHTVPALQEVIVGEDLKLCPLDQSHAKGILAVLERDPTIRDRVAAAARMHTEDDVAKEIEAYRQDPGKIQYTLLRGETPVGFVSFWRDVGFYGEPPHLNDYGFGTFIDSNERGQGLSPRSRQAIMDVAARTLGVRQFVSFCEDNNASSIAALTKLGFEPTDTVFTEPGKDWRERKYIKKPK